jgi:hypothetical protein
MNDKRKDKIAVLTVMSRIDGRCKKGIANDGYGQEEGQSEGIWTAKEVGAWRGAVERDRSMDSLFVPAYLFDTSTQGCLSVILLESETGGTRKS